MNDNTLYAFALVLVSAWALLLIGEPDLLDMLHSHFQGCQP